MIDDRVVSEETWKSMERLFKRDIKEHRDNLIAILDDFYAQKELSNFKDFTIPKEAKLQLDKIASSSANLYNALVNLDINYPSVATVLEIYGLNDVFNETGFTLEKLSEVVKLSSEKALNELRTTKIGRPKKEARDRFVEKIYYYFQQDLSHLSSFKDFESFVKLMLQAAFENGTIDKVPSEVRKIPAYKKIKESWN